jgi:hypothetical protein
MHTETSYSFEYFERNIMGRELFDYAFKVANRWKFKHPTQKTFLEQWKMHLL